MFLFKNKYHIDMNNTHLKLSVIGGTGFLGKFFVETMSKKGIKSKLLIHKQQKIHSNESYFGDILDNASLEKFLQKDDVVVNFTGQIGNNLEDYVKTNLTGSLNLLNSCIAKQVKHVILISTINVYGNNCDTPSIETDPIKPVTLYSLVKSVTEKIYKYYSENLKLNVTILRLSHIYGVDKKIGIISNLISSLENHNALKVSHNGNQERDFLYIDDAIQGIVNTLDCLQDGLTIYNISSEEKISTNNLIKILEKIYDSRIPYEKQNNFPNEKCIWASHQKAKKYINFFPKVKLEDGLQKIILAKKANNDS